jgi:hypothetical protein
MVRVEQNGSVAGQADRDAVWNRAAMEAGGNSPREGDLALAALLKFHSLAMSGGVLDAMEHLDEEDLQRAVNGFRFFAVEEAAAFLADATSRWRSSEQSLDVADQLEAEFDAGYDAVVPNDDALFAAFSRHFEGRPADFSPADPPVP